MEVRCTDKYIFYLTENFSSVFLIKQTNNNSGVLSFQAFHCIRGVAVKTLTGNHIDSSCSTLILWIKQVQLSKRGQNAKLWKLQPRSLAVVVKSSSTDCRMEMLYQLNSLNIWILVGLWIVAEGCVRKRVGNLSLFDRAGELAPYAN